MLAGAKVRIVWDKGRGEMKMAMKIKRLPPPRHSDVSTSDFLIDIAVSAVGTQAPAVYLATAQPLTAPAVNSNQKSQSQ